MDPEISLRNLRAAFARLNEQSSNVQEINSADVDNAIDAFKALDEWLSGSGYLPSDWERTISSSIQVGDPVYYQENGPDDDGVVIEVKMSALPTFQYKVSWKNGHETDWYHPSQLVAV